MGTLNDKYIRFDWAIKRLLRQKANFDVLEGFLTVFLNEKVEILEILESEGNQKAEDDKFNRVDIKAKNSKGEIIIVEVQNTSELYYLERILYGVAKAITEHINLGDTYKEVKKVYSISILYFDLGKGADYLYVGQNKFIGVHTHDQLMVSSKEKGTIVRKSPTEIFPEYILVRVNEFNKVAVTPLEEWVAYLKNGIIKDDTTAPGLQRSAASEHSSPVVHKYPSQRLTLRPVQKIIPPGPPRIAERSMARISHITVPVGIDNIVAQCPQVTDRLEGYLKSFHQRE